MRIVGIDNKLSILAPPCEDLAGAFGPHASHAALVVEARVVVRLLLLRHSVLAWAAVGEQFVVLPRGESCRQPVLGRQLWNHSVVLFTHVYVLFPVSKLILRILLHLI